MSDKIGELTKDLATLQHKAQENEARWQAVCADLEAKLELAREALEIVWAGHTEQARKRVSLEALSKMEQITKGEE